MVLPPNLLRAGLGSKLSMWLVPPIMKSQMTLLAFGAKCGRPSGGDQVESAPRAIPSRWSIAPRTMPVKPMPTSARNALRGTRPHPASLVRLAAIVGSPSLASRVDRSADGHEVVVVEQHVHEAL